MELLTGGLTSEHNMIEKITLCHVPNDLWPSCCTSGAVIKPKLKEKKNENKPCKQTAHIEFVFKTDGSSFLVQQI